MISVHLKQLREQLSSEQIEQLKEEFNYKSIASVYRCFEVSKRRGLISNIDLINRATELVQERRERMTEVVDEVKTILEQSKVNTNKS